MTRRARLISVAAVGLVAPLLAVGENGPAHAEPSPGEWSGTFSVTMETVEDGGLFRQWSTVEVTVSALGPGEGYGTLRFTDFGWESDGCSAAMVEQDPAFTNPGFHFHEEDGHLLADISGSETVDLLIDECGTERLNPVISTDWIYFCGDPIPDAHDLDLGLIEDDPDHPGRRVVSAPTDVTCEPGDAQGSWTMTPALAAAGAPARVPSTITLNYAAGRLVRLNGQVNPNAAGAGVVVRLEKKTARGWLQVGVKAQSLSAASRYVIQFPRQGVLFCRATARFTGNQTLLPSRATKIFSC